MNNALKYSDCTLFQVNVGLGVMKITHNGKGFNIQGEFAGNGLKNMKQRAKEIKGNLELLSSTSEGTSVILKF